jgi:hypothetical protein
MTKTMMMVRRNEVSSSFDRALARDLLQSKSKLILTFLSQALFSVSASLLAFAGFLSTSFVLCSEYAPRSFLL